MWGKKSVSVKYSYSYKTGNCISCVLRYLQTVKFSLRPIYLYIPYLFEQLISARLLHSGKPHSKAGRCFFDNEHTSTKSPSSLYNCIEQQGPLLRNFVAPDWFKNICYLIREIRWFKNFICYMCENIISKIQISYQWVYPAAECRVSFARRTSCGELLGQTVLW